MAAVGRLRLRRATADVGMLPLDISSPLSVRLSESSIDPSTIRVLTLVQMRCAEMDPINGNCKDLRLL